MSNSTAKHVILAETTFLPHLDFLKSQMQNPGHNYERAPAFGPNSTNAAPSAYFMQNPGHNYEKGPPLVPQSTNPAPSGWPKDLTSESKLFPQAFQNPIPQSKC